SAPAQTASPTAPGGTASPDPATARGGQRWRTDPHIPAAAAPAPPSSGIATPHPPAPPASRTAPESAACAPPASQSANPGSAPAPRSATGPDEPHPPVPPASAGG